MHVSACQSLAQKAVDGAETQLTSGGAVKRANHLVQNPGQLVMKSYFMASKRQQFFKHYLLFLRSRLT